MCELNIRNALSSRIHDIFNEFEPIQSLCDSTFKDISETIAKDIINRKLKIVEIKDIQRSIFIKQTTFYPLEKVELITSAINDEIKCLFK